MAGFFPRGTMKPPLGASINGAHPFGQHLFFAVLFNDATVATTVIGNPTLLGGTGVTAGLHPASLAYNINTAPAWTSNRDGGALRLTTARSLQVLDSYAGTSGAWLPAADVTVCLVRRKVDTTLRNAATFGSGDPSDASRGGAFVPWGDGTVYFDFGGQSGANRITVAGLSFSTAIPERWIFHAGARGSAMWQNGVKVASQATAITRTPSASGFSINGGSTTGDEQEFNYFAVYNTQWSDQLCQWWSAEPYAHLYPDRAQAFDFLAESGTTEIDSVGTAAGVATVAGVGAYSVPHPKSGFGAQKKARRHNR